MVLLDKSLLICPKKKFKRLYLNSLDTDSADFAKYERARCIRHLSLYSLIILCKGGENGKKGSSEEGSNKGVIKINS